MILVFAEHEQERLSEPSAEAITFARRYGDVEVVTIGEADVTTLGRLGVQRIHSIALEGSYAPQAWGAAVAQAATTSADIVMAAGTERGNEVLAHAAVDLHAPFAANCLERDGTVVTRIRWGGSLHERATIEGPTVLLSVAPHSVEAESAAVATDPQVLELRPDLPAESLAVRIVDEEQASEGVTLATAKVVVSGGRGVGSSEGFAELEELAALLGGKVGCSRVATNNGWRNHADQVGQTGTVIAPDLYIACGISGAIQHWVGMMASKNILAINTDAEAPMVTKADYAIIGDLHEVVPAISEAVRNVQS